MPWPDPATIGAPIEFTWRPETAAERVFCSIWGRVLGVDQVGVQDDFFAELGGHSLLATQAVSRLQDALRMRLPLQLMFECPTIASLLAKLFQDPVVRRKIERTAELLLKVVQVVQPRRLMNVCWRVAASIAHRPR